MIAIIDYGVGNIGSLVNMCEHLGIDAIATSDGRELARATKLVLPGVGAFDRAMRSLQERNLIPVLTNLVMEEGVPVLGICLGMQLLSEGSDEGSLPGLGWISGSCRKIGQGNVSDIKVPHIGWAPVARTKETAIFPRNEEYRFYFAHSYHVVCSRPEDVAATVRYGDELCAAISVGNISGVQFHPEKSHRYGMRLLQAFAGGAA